MVPVGLEPSSSCLLSKSPSRQTWLSSFDCCTWVSCGNTLLPFCHAGAQSKTGQPEQSGHSIFLVIAVGSKVATGAEAEQSRVLGPFLGAVRRTVLPCYIGLGRGDSVNLGMLKAWEREKGDEYKFGCSHVWPLIFNFFAKVIFECLSIALEAIPASPGASWS